VLPIVLFQGILVVIRVSICGGSKMPLSRAFFDKRMSLKKFQQVRVPRYAKEPESPFCLYG
jgi:hypothetical protein